MPASMAVLRLPSYVLQASYDGHYEQVDALLHCVSPCLCWQAPNTWQCVPLSYTCVQGSLQLIFVLFIASFYIWQTQFVVFGWNELWGRMSESVAGYVVYVPVCCGTLGITTLETPNWPWCGYSLFAILCCFVALLHKQLRHVLQSGIVMYCHARFTTDTFISDIILTTDTFIPDILTCTSIWVASVALQCHNIMILSWLQLAV